MGKGPGALEGLVKARIQRAWLDTLVPAPGTTSH